MANEVVKPDFSYQWSSGGAIVAPSNVKIQTGWTAEVPPFQWENWSQNRQDNAILHLFQKGISEWDAVSNYYFTTSGVRSYVQGSDGNIYVAKADSVNQNPVTDSTQTYWTRAFPNTNPAIGVSANLKAGITVANASLTFTADEVVVGSALGGSVHKIASLNKVINLATTGAGGMDTGAAPVNGWVGVYVIYNPITSVSALLAVNAASLVPSVYAGANMPAGYTESALISVARTNPSSQFYPLVQVGRRISYSQLIIASAAIVTNVSISIATGVPQNAVSTGGWLSCTSTVSAALGITVYSDSVLSGGRSFASTNSTNASTPFSIDIRVPQTLWYSTGATAGTPNFSINLSYFEI